ncbi:MAG TPA: trypsin-like peptidase domain-containing protein [Opitutus sp.]|nr:trypsin-like peptidase domain-containing protein [Opitutus sp.]
MAQPRPRSFAHLAFAGALFFCLAGFSLAAETRVARADSVAPPAASPLQTATPVPGTPPAAAPMVENSVVKVFSTMRYPDVFRPWSKQAPAEATGSGVVIEGKRILTNAHVVLYASQVQVQANQAGDKIPATVEMIAPGIDLAVLKLDDESFFASHPPLPRASQLPEIKDTVMAYGFPAGGSSLSITKGIVSRIEFTNYNFPTSGLVIQIDAAINPGNSGGAAVVDGRMIGLVFSRLGGADNIGYIIPCEEIELFLADIADGHYDGKPAMFDEYQTIENPALRRYLKLDKSINGVVIHHPYRDDAAYPLKEWDIVTKIGGTPIDDQGMVKLGPNLRVRFYYLVQKLAHGGKLPLTIIRDGQPRDIELPVSADRDMLISDLHGTYPSYFIFGPLVFSTATSQFAASFNNNASYLGFLSFLGSPIVTRRGDKPAFPGEQLVVVSSPFLPHRLANGYGPPTGFVVKSVNGTPVKNLLQLVELLRDGRDEFVVIDYEGRSGEAMVFPRKETLAATDDILSDNGIRAQGSPDTLAVWNVQPAK